MDTFFLVEGSPPSFFENGGSSRQLFPPSPVALCFFARVGRCSLVEGDRLVREISLNPLSDLVIGVMVPSLPPPLAPPLRVKIPFPLTFGYGFRIPYTSSLFPRKFAFRAKPVNLRGRPPQ